MTGGAWDTYRKRGSKRGTFLHLCVRIPNNHLPRVLGRSMHQDVQIPSSTDTPEQLPTNWPRWLMAAYIRSMGASQKKAATAAGVSERTVRTWENEKPELWKRAREEARELWASDMDGAARARVLTAVRDEDDTQTAKWWLERMDPGLRQAKLEELTAGKGSGTGGGGVELVIVGGSFGYEAATDRLDVGREMAGVEVLEADTELDVSDSG